MKCKNCNRESKIPDVNCAYCCKAYEQGYHAGLNAGKRIEKENSSLSGHSDNKGENNE